MPTFIEKRLMDKANRLDEKILELVKAVRNNSWTPSKSFAGEIYAALVETYNLGIGMKGESRKKIGSE